MELLPFTPAGHLAQSKIFDSLPLAGAEPRSAIPTAAGAAERYGLH